MPSPYADKLARVHAASLSDAMRKLHPHRHHVLGLVTPTPGRVLFGRAVTMTFVPPRADVDKAQLDFERHLRAAAGPGPEGAVLVCTGPPDAAVAGGVRLAMVGALGLSGVLTTSKLRDFDEVRRYPFAVYCRGETPVAGSSEAMPAATNVPVALDGATVMPGDHVYADAAGAIVIPARDVDRVLDLAADIEREDAARAEKLRRS